MTSSTVVTVTDGFQLQQTVLSYLSQGYSLVSQNESSAVLVKPKQLNWLWMIIGFFICIIPMIIYLIKYQNEQDKIVEIRLVTAGSAAGPTLASSGQVSAGDRPPPPDSVVPPPPSAANPPPDPSRTQLSADGAWWWDGTRWQAVK